MKRRIPFAIREGGRTVGSGVVAKITDLGIHFLKEARWSNLADFLLGKAAGYRPAVSDIDQLN